MHAPNQPRSIDSGVTAPFFDENATVRGNCQRASSIRTSNVARDVGGRAVTQESPRRR